MKLLFAKADRLEREQRPLPTVPGWYPGIVVERGGESCTGALLADDGGWRTAREVDGRYGHWIEGTPNLTIRWAEQDRHAEALDPPEALESLRAERDEALAEMEEVGAAWRQEQIMHQKAWATIRNLQAELADTRTDLHKANAEVYRLRAAIPVAEAAWGRCQRED